MKIFFFLIYFSSLLFSQTFVYECDNNRNFVIQIRKNDAWLFTKELSVSLAPSTSVGGEKYENDGVIFFLKDYEAVLNTPSEVYSGCSNNRYKAVWEDAKLRGNDFRAVGNEPGWYLEIAQAGKKALLVTDYGDEKYELILSQPFISQERRTARYRIKGFIDILIETENCIDSVTGFLYESKVKVLTDGRAYIGCGKALH